MPTVAGGSKKPVARKMAAQKRAQKPNPAAATGLASAAAPKKKVPVKKRASASTSSAVAKSKKANAKSKEAGNGKGSSGAVKSSMASRNMANRLKMEDVLLKGNALKTSALTPENATLLEAAIAEAGIGEVHELDADLKRDLDAAVVKWKWELSVRTLAASEGTVWSIEVAKLAAVVKLCTEVHGKTPIILDNASSAAATFFKYTAHVPIDAKACVVQKAMGIKTIEEIQEDLRQKLVTSMAQGYPLVVDMNSAAPNFKGQLCSDDAFPLNALLTEKHVGFNGKVDGPYFSSAANTEEVHNRLTAAGSNEHQELRHSRTIGRCTGMHTILISKFAEEDYAEFLSPMLPPMAHFQAIKLMDA